MIQAISLRAADSDGKMFDVDVSDLQDDISISGNNVSGTLKFLSGSNPITDHWGEGNFFAFQLSADDWTDYTSVKVGVDPSQGSGLVEIIDDPDKNGIVKIADKNVQKFMIVATDGKKTKKQVYDLSGLTIEDDAEG